MTATREQQLEQRIADLENTVAQLTRASLAAVEHLGRNVGYGSRGGNGWMVWQRLDASHQALNDLHGFLKRHPAPDQD